MNAMRFPTRFNKLIRLQKRKLFILHLCCLPIDCTKKMWVSTKYKSCRESHGIHYSATWLALKLFFKLRVNESKVPIFIANSSLNPFHFVRPFQLKWVKVTKKFDVREIFDDGFSHLSVDVNSAEDDESFKFWQIWRPLKYNIVMFSIQIIYALRVERWSTTHWN